MLTQTLTRPRWSASAEADIPAALLWRLPSLGIPLDSVEGMRPYAEKLFSRGAFQRSLSSVERSLAA